LFIGFFLGSDSFLLGLRHVKGSTFGVRFFRGDFIFRK
jgi:hypothetical protein